MSLEDDIKSAAEAIEENPELLVTKSFEVLESIIGSIDNPIAIIVAIFLVPTLLKFGWGIISTIFDFLWEAIKMIFEVAVGMFRGFGQIIGFAIDVKRELKQRKQRKPDPFDQLEGITTDLEGRFVSDKPVKVKSVKKSKPDDDLATSLKCNLLDE